ncbi:uncharacterized protein [Watersipora subatra]|uniref:uncharacterized protein n=1 Tax=Watersipora subatra TaxID=2589382 RepID=UPI00355ADAFB
MTVWTARVGLSPKKISNSYDTSSLVLNAKQQSSRSVQPARHQQFNPLDTISATHETPSVQPTRHHQFNPLDTISATHLAVLSQHDMKAVMMFIIISALISQLDAIRCYSCATCSKPTGVTNCGENVIGCTKVDVNGVVGRSCGTSCYAGCQAEKSGWMEMITCSCEGDLCNAADTVTISFFVFAAAFLAARLYN